MNSAALLRVIKKRRSVRVYKAGKVSDKQLAAILEAARWAPSGANTQPWEFVVTRDKETKRPLQADIKGASCLVAHGSMAAVESVVLGCPVVVDPSSAAALVGQTENLECVEKPIYPERQPWLNALAYSQFTEEEMVSGVLWKLIT